MSMQIKARISKSLKEIDLRTIKLCKKRETLEIETAEKHKHKETKCEI